MHESLELRQRQEDERKYDGSFNGVLGKGLGTSRALFHFHLRQYALHLGISIRHAAKAVDYFETDIEGGAVLENGETFSTDVVVAADGIRSRSWQLISGTKEVQFHHISNHLPTGFGDAGPVDCGRIPGR
jgi:2-polyprenyl-6-methoxyphenol hydroxylase-like FAD-dependent oxidoreductase